VPFVANLPFIFPSAYNPIDYNNSIEDGSSSIVPFDNPKKKSLNDFPESFIILISYWN
jgi:hypothetical protein